MKNETMKNGRTSDKLNAIVGKIVIVELEDDGFKPRIFSTQAEAERWLVTDAVDTFNGSDRSLQNGNAEDWGSDVYICEIKRVCRPVPNVKITARIMDVPNASHEARENQEGN
jgi:hypothetical protein